MAVVLLCLVVWLSATVVRLENFRYATSVGYMYGADGNSSGPGWIYREV